MAKDAPKTFWSSLPGILTGIAALLGAIGGLLITLNQLGYLRPQPERAALPPTGIYSSGSGVIRGTWTWDFDRGQQTREGDDVWWQQKTETERSLTPMNGARFTVVGIREFDGIGPSDLDRLQFSPTPINGSNASSNQIPEGTVVAGITDEGRRTKFVVTNYGYNLHIRWVTYE